MIKPRKLLPITEYLMEHVTARMWGYRNPTLYLDRVLMKWEDRQTEDVGELVEALRDMLGGWRYIRMVHGDLYGVGWDRAQQKAEQAIAKFKDKK